MFNMQCTNVRSSVSRVCQGLCLAKTPSGRLAPRIRPEEATTLAKNEIDLLNGKMRIRWGRSKAAKRTLDLTTESRQILERRMQGSSRWIFPSTRKRGSSIGRINPAHDSIVAEAAKQGVVIECLPYDFRHTFGTRVAESNIDLPTLAALLGHGSIRCVQKYVHPTAEHKKSAMKRYDRKLRQASRNTKRKSK